MKKTSFTNENLLTATAIQKPQHIRGKIFCAQETTYFSLYITHIIYVYVCLSGVQCAGAGCTAVLGPPGRAGEQA